MLLQIHLLGSPSGTGMQVEKLRGPDGFTVLSVDKGGSAWRAGVRPGDVIAEELAVPVGSDQFEAAQSDFIDALCSLKTKELVVFKVRRIMQESSLAKERRIHVKNQGVSASSVVVVSRAVRFFLTNWF